MSIVEIKRIEFNRNNDHYEFYEIGIEDVINIREGQHIDKSFYRVEFNDGAFQEIFNVDRVYWDEKDDVAIPGENYKG